MNNLFKSNTKVFLSKKKVALPDGGGSAMIAANPQKTRERCARRARQR
jgi:hypothetical protein